MWLPSLNHCEYQTPLEPLLFCVTAAEAKMSFLYVEHNLHITTWIHPVKSAQLYTIHTWYQIRSCERNLFVKSIWVSTHRHWHHHLVLCHFWRFKREYYSFFTFTSLVDLISSRNVYLKNCIFMLISRSKSVISVLYVLCIQ